MLMTESSLNRIICNVVFLIPFVGVLGMSSINRTCMHYSENDMSGNSTDVCRGSDYYCFAVWSNRKLPDNTTVTTIVRKGCFRVSFSIPDFEHPCGNECVQRPAFDSMAKERNISGFCCCDKSYCNKNFTMTEYDLNASPSPSKKPGMDSLFC